MENIMRRIIYFLILLPFCVWGAVSLWYGSWPSAFCVVVSCSYAAAHLGFILILPKKRVVLSCLCLFLIPLSAFFLRQPAHERNWQPDVAFMPYVDITGDIVVVHYVRNIEYITEKEFIPSYETRVYDLSKLRSVDMILSDWGLRYIAHTMVSFGFDDGRYLCFSIETRKEEGEEYSAIKGFFRQFELIYLAGDERDLVRLRTNVRQGEDVYLYRLKIASVDNARNALMEYLERINHLHNHPEWYNALTENCMTSSYRLTRKHALPERAKWHWSIILNGFSDRYAYEKGIIDTSLAFEELKRISRINARAVSADDATDFSRMIREGLPGMDWYSEL
ncbi:DUF4105 domain-containing protein [Desulfatiferula olefinivorans]